VPSGEPRHPDPGSPGRIAAPRVAVLGASGYAGALAAALLHRHPRFELAAITSRSDAGKRLDALYPRYRVPMVMEELDLDRHADGLDAAVVAYPHHAAAPVVAGLRERGVRVVDLSADFRFFIPSTYEQWYGAHPALDLLDEAVYGLPELGAFYDDYRERIAASDLVANPGCFPTATLLALAPLAHRMVDAVVDAKTGVSGAGRAATEKTHFVTVTENVNPYGVDGHRHEPEINEQLAGLAAGVTPSPGVTFIPHLVPLDQGELISAYVDLRSEMDGAELWEIFSEAYADEPFVEMVEQPPGVRDVRETNLCRIAVRARPLQRRVLVFAAIDNLWKGTSSQAVQNLNLMFGFPEGEGIS
jgi:N-acetyl-gamma-glutamyl-phosphate reductase